MFYRTYAYMQFESNFSSFVSLILIVDSKYDCSYHVICDLETLIDFVASEPVSLLDVSTTIQQPQLNFAHAISQLLQ